MVQQWLAEFETESGNKYPAIGLAWRRTWNEVACIGACASSSRPGGTFPNDEVAMKLLDLALRNIGVHRKPAIEWRVVYAQFVIFFSDGVPTTIR
jgi:putative transposase